MTCFFYLERITPPVAESVFQAVERAFTAAPLGYWVDPDDGSLIAAGARSAELAPRMAAGPAVLCDGQEDEMSAVSITVTEMPAGYLADLPCIELDLWFPWAEHARVPTLVREIAEATDALCGGATPGPARGAINTVLAANNAARGSWAPPPSPAMPRGLDWVSYWSEETCRWLKFSPTDARASLFARVMPVGSGVLLQLTDTVLNLDRPEHQAALKALCEAFPALM